MKFGIIILSGGSGKRMNSDLPKVLHKLNGKPLLKHVIDVSKKLNPEGIGIIVGEHSKIIQSEINDSEIEYILQEYPKGTGHALQCAEEFIKRFDKVLVLSGDVPLITEETLNKMINTESECTLLVNEMEDPTGYGRIIRNFGKESKVSIIEEKDCTLLEKEIKEVNSGIYCFKSEELLIHLHKLECNNAQSEYYLTDLIKYFYVQVVKTENNLEIKGINTKEQLNKLQKYTLICFGTRPEYIKVKSLIDNLCNIKTCFTGQHEDLLKDINVDYKLSMNKELSENRLNNIFSNILSYNIFDDIEYVIVQGDTSTACAVALSAFNHGKKIIHLEAGLRSGNLTDPYPEEMNRQVISRLADIHLCPTEFNKKNLLKENVSGKIYVVGNTGLDNISKDGCEYNNKVLITMHRRDNHHNMDKWFEELEKIANIYFEIEFMIPLHPNPNVQKHRGIFKKVKVIEPMSHYELIEYVKKCKFVIGDSGGLQEECSYLNKKIIVCRKTTERPESVGVNSFMCGEPELLKNLVDKINNDYEVDAECPYGDGKSWKKIIKLLVV